MLALKSVPEDVAQFSQNHVMRFMSQNTPNTERRGAKTLITRAREVRGN